MKKVHIRVDPDKESSFPKGKIDLDRVDTTSDREIQEQIDQDNREAMGEIGEYIRRIRARVGMSQMEFSQQIGISVDTLRNWEQGRRYPTATARALLRIIDRAPEIAVAVLQE
jgi:putative transcriptional regulator